MARLRSKELDELIAAAMEGFRDALDVKPYWFYAPWPPPDDMEQRWLQCNSSIHPSWAHTILEAKLAGKLLAEACNREGFEAFAQRRAADGDRVIVDEDRGIALVMHHATLLHQEAVSFDVLGIVAKVKE